MSGGKAEAMEKVYYVDYKGMIDPGRTAREHVGVLSIPVKNRILLLRPGLQRIAAALWESVREHGQIGYDQASKSYKGELVKRGTIRVYEPKDGKMDYRGMMTGYKQFFGTKEQPNKPARTTVQVVLPAADSGALIEIDLVAVRWPSTPAARKKQAMSFTG